MSRHDDQPRLRHMVDHAVEAVELTRGRKLRILRFAGRFLLVVEAYGPFSSRTRRRHGVHGKHKPSFPRAERD